MSEQQSNCQFASFRNDGIVVMYINGQRYVYFTDAMYHPRWQKMLAAHPSNGWRILNQIKDKIKEGIWKQLEPEPTPQKTPTPVPTKLVQRTFDF